MLVVSRLKISAFTQDRFAVINKALFVATVSAYEMHTFPTWMFKASGDSKMSCLAVTSNNCIFTCRCLGIACINLCFISVVDSPPTLMKLPPLVQVLIT